MSNINNNVTNTLVRFLSSHKKSYFIIGGHATAHNLSLIGLDFRVTRDYDIVIVSEVEDRSFADDLVSLLVEGDYKSRYQSDAKKRRAYRFENPSNDAFPECIEFFVKEGEEASSVTKRFEKLDITIDNEKISAMVMKSEIYEFAKAHVTEINNLMFADKQGLIALKAYAYFENYKLYLDGKVHSDSYKKHFRDILHILSAFYPNEIKQIDDLPPILKDAMIKFVEELKNKNVSTKIYRIKKDDAVDILTKLI